MALLGTDISTWEDDPNTQKEIDFQMMKDAGAWFCIFKASQAKRTDRVFSISWSDCKGILPRGAYHYLDWTCSELDQADYFSRVLEPDMPEGPVIADYECTKNIPPDAQGRLWNFLTRVEKNLGVIPVIYTGPYFWLEHGTPNLGWTKYPLHIANYQVQKPMIPPPWTEYLLWQFTDRGPGGVYGAEAKGIDLNYFNNEKYDFEKVFGSKPQEPPKELTVEEKVNVIEAEARSKGWQLWEV